MKDKRFRNIFITIFVLLWLFVFNYESIRYFYLNPFFDRQLPKIKFLFPPAGWIMFFQVDDQAGFAQVYGVKDEIPHPIDPHQILKNRTIGYDNVHRNVLSTVLSRGQQRPFCRYLQRRFPYFEDFLVTAIHYPSLIKTPYRRIQQVVYQCQ